MEPSGLDQLLQSQQKEASYLDSAGFSIDSLRSRAKLAQFQLPEPGLWLVKLVQAAVALEATSIKIGFGQGQVNVQFWAPSLPQASQILDLVLSGQIPKDPALLHLVTCIRCSACDATQSVHWSCGDHTVTLDSQGTSLSPFSEPVLFRLSATRPYRSRSLSKTLASPVSYLIRQVAEEHEALVSRCWACPVQIRLDGRPLQSSYASPLQFGLLQTPFEVIMQ